jgi:hypothetical protein
MAVVDSVGLVDVNCLGLISQQRLAERGCKELGLVHFVYDTVCFRMYMKLGMTGSELQVAVVVVVVVVVVVRCLRN